MESTKILICEDESLVALELKQRLHDFGYEVTGIASKSEEARRSAAKNRPDIALMDVQLHGDASGPDIAESLKREFGIPSIYLTAYGDEDTVARASQTEPLGYLVKPVRDKELDLTIRFGLAQFRAQKALKDKVVRTNERLAHTQSILDEMNTNLMKEIKMRGLQDLIGGIAHYFNNSIMSIAGYLEFLNDGTSLHHFQSRQVKSVLQIYEDQKTFVKKLLWSSGNASYNLAFHSIKELAEAVIEEVRESIKPEIKISLSLGEQKTHPMIDVEAISHALKNVIYNAVEAINDSGSITINVYDSYEDTPERFNSDALPGMYVVISVQDSGSGIPNEVLSKVFEPFYTTKIDRLATGLGLSEAFGIMQDHKGGIEIQSTPGLGTKVQMYIPHSKQIVSK